MIEGFLSDLKKMTLIGIILSFIGFAISAVFLIFLGLSTSTVGYSLFNIVSKEYEKRKSL